ncbi:MAG: hypothetical protein KC910_12625 [Candidatus Eremiobacteraeota bacterium]|nr:hypothetical protein [Candidatus Eremiobacteraeota bacterium]
MKAIDLLRQTIQLGEHLLATADEDDYASWNDVVLRTLRVLFGPSSEQFLSFRFPGGGQAGGTSTAETPEERKMERIRNTITRKLSVLKEVETDLEAGSVDAALGWTHSADTLHESLTQLGNQFASPDRA